MKRYILIMFTIGLQLAGLSQRSDTLSIEECFRIANENSPLQRQKTISGEALSYKINNLSNKWFPTVGFNAQALYNSETVDFSTIMKNLPVPISPLPHDQYKLWADVNQPIYDGGMIRSQKAVEKASYEAGIQQIETELRAIKQQVSQVYFSLLMTKKRTAILQVTLDELSERKKIIRAGVENGVLLNENLLAIEAEELKLKQNLTELKLTNIQLFKVLSILVDSSLTEETAITEPGEPGGFNNPVDRPEYLLFEKQKETYLANQKLASSADFPRLFAFSQVAYGRPGYNIVSSDFHAFYSVGLAMKWNLLNYGDTRRQKKIFGIQKDIIDIKRETFDDQLNIQLETENANIEKFNELLLQDGQIIHLRKTISATSLAKLTSGIITATDYLTDLNAEILARLQYETHKILKLQASYNYLLLKGTL